MQRLPPHLPINDSLSLSPFRTSDHAALVSVLGASPVYHRWMHAIPFPYTDRHAREFIALSRSSRLLDLMAWAIRLDGRLVGSAGLRAIRPRGEACFGYWVAEPYWNRGIATAAGGRAVTFAERSFGLRRITADVLPGNRGSLRVLEKLGFVCSGPTNRPEGARLLRVLRLTRASAGR